MECGNQGKLHLNPILVAEWPKLAWAATIDESSAAVDVLHGTMVEIGENWIVEAVWAGNFDSGGFDQTDLVFGSGIRLRGDKVIFVSSGTGADRIWYCRQKGLYRISNSLPALLAVADINLLDDYGTGYTSDIESVERLGLDEYKHNLPTSGGDVHQLYFHNLAYEKGKLTIIEKTKTVSHLNTYEKYYSFLEKTAILLSSNITAEKRKYKISQLATISSGYDSTAAAAVGKIAGCTQTVTIRNSTSFWRGCDSGSEVAKEMGLSCKEYIRKEKSYKREITLWAASGLAGGMNFTIFDYPKPLCILYTGCYGDVVWDKKYHDLSNPVGDRDALIGEFRIFEGLFHSIVPWWGISRAQEINALGSNSEMKPWAIDTGYDRPVPRRLAEEKGARRESFGQLKRNTSANVQFLWPFSKDEQSSYRQYLKKRGRFAPGPLLVWFFRNAAHFEKLLYRNVLQRFGIKKRFRPWVQIQKRGLLFQWANHELKKFYKKGLENI